jgi:hypothetical protein
MAHREHTKLSTQIYSGITTGIKIVVAAVMLYVFGSMFIGLIRHLLAQEWWGVYLALRYMSPFFVVALFVTISIVMKRRKQIAKNEAESVSNRALRPNHLNRVLVYICLFLIVPLIGVGCIAPTLSKPVHVIGVYRGSYAGGEETFVFRKDGKFSQKFVKATGEVIYNSSGSWHFCNDLGDFDNYVELAPFYDCFDDDVEGRIRKYSGGLFPVSEDGWISFNDDKGHIVYKQ